MAKILNQKEQQIALKNVNNMIKDLAKVNEFLAAANSDGIYSIEFTDESNTRFSAPLLCTNKEEVNRFVQAYKDQKSQEILQLVEEFHLALDDQDKEILGISNL